MTPRLGTTPPTPPAPGTPFAARLRWRHDWYWRHRGLSLHDWITCRHTYLTQDDPLTRWRCCPRFQRRLSNKWNSREFARKLGIPVPRLYWSGTHLDAIPFDQLPPRYAVRSAIGYSRRAVLVMSHGRNLLVDRPCDPPGIRDAMRPHVRRLPRRRVLVEEFIAPEPGTEAALPREYKFFVFGGHVGVVNVIERTTPPTAATFGPAWDRLPPIDAVLAEPAVPPPKPACFEEMLAAAATFGSAVGAFVRVDLYAGARGPVFGETTGTPSEGRFFTEFANRHLTALWDRHCPGQP